MKDLVAKNLGEAELHWSGPRWSRSAVILKTVFVGLGTHEPGWRWSQDCRDEKDSEAHIGYVISGKMGVRSATGEEAAIELGGAFEVGPGHDAWVIGDEPCVALDFGEHRPS